ncbi:hypothetical protein RI844_15865 [Thalassotalea fonticola]|uniref:DUF2946 domain-containing protein n=1 Tax=Thalassotalea fonticola TaxID=3065649 RepID=A0ABZ0GLS3_9GAMM|nr:hypothetical protein RI844_15865 [Colwelliaceae bacterium S1-1]
MTRLFNIFRFNIALSGLQLAQYLLIASLVSQSAFAATDMCSVYESNTLSAEFNAQLNLSINNTDSNLYQDNTDDLCAEQSGECCAACSNVMFTSLTLPTTGKTSDALLLNNNRMHLAAPYYALLRPPKY